MDLTLARTLILAVGWPLLIVGSVFMLRATFVFYRGVKRGVIGKLVFLMAVVQAVSMYVLAVFATALLLTDLSVGVAVVLPGFFVWSIVFVIALVVTSRWGKEAIGINKIYQNLEVRVKERTQELELTNRELAEQSKKHAAHAAELEKFNHLMVERELKMVELKKEVTKLKEKLAGDINNKT